MGIEELLERVVKEMTDFPEEVAIDSHVTKHTASFDIYVADSDVGKVLGRHAWNVDALRTVFGAIYKKNRMRLHLQVIGSNER